MKILVTMSLALLFVVSGILPAAAYVGPGAGLSLLGAFWGLLLAVVAALGFVIFWPLRRLFRRDRAKEPERAPVGRPADEALPVGSEPRSRTL
jgi:membrane protein implicated in regulation of membrane protease activity